MMITYFLLVDAFGVTHHHEFHVHYAFFVLVFDLLLTAAAAADDDDDVPVVGDALSSCAWRKEFHVT